MRPDELRVHSCQLTKRVVRLRLIAMRVIEEAFVRVVGILTALYMFRTFVIVNCLVWSTVKHCIAMRNRHATTPVHSADLAHYRKLRCTCSLIIDMRMPLLFKAHLAELIVYH